MTGGHETPCQRTEGGMDLKRPLGSRKTGQERFQADGADLELDLLDPV